MRSLLIVVGVFLFSSSAHAFSDVSSSHTYAHAIAALSDAGVVGGYGDGTYRPERLLNRAEFVKIVVGSIYETHEIQGCTAPSFFDVAIGSWYVPYVCKAKADGLVAGYPDGSFGPETAINVAEAAKILSVAYGLSSSLSTPWYVTYIQALQSEQAYPPTISAVDALVNRGEMAAMVAKLSGLIDTISQAPSIPSFSLVSQELLQLTNALRIQRGLTPMTLNPLLTTAAQLHADDMSSRSYLSHTSPEGSTADSRIRATGYLDISYETCSCSSWSTLVGENIAQGQKNVQSVMDDWMASSAHRANILSPIYDEVGFARAGDYWVTTFGNVTLH